MRYRSSRRSGVSSIVGSIFFVLIMIVAIASLVTIFNSFTAYNGTVERGSAANLQSQETSLAFPSFQFGSPGTPATVTGAGPPPLALDGSASAGSTVAGTATISVALTTAQFPDVIYVVVANDNGATINVPTASGLTFTQRGSQVNGRSESIADFYAIASSPLSSVTITATDGGRNDMVIVAFGIVGANTASPFDTHAGIPASATGRGTSASVTISTTNANDFIIGAFADSGTHRPSRGTAGTGFTLIATQGDNADQIVDGSAEYQIVSTAQTNLAVTFTADPSASDWAGIADAVVRAPAAQTTTADATAYTSQQKLIHSSGLWWEFYSTGTYITCQTSSDGLTWSAARAFVPGGSVVGGGHGYDYSLWLSGPNTLYYATAPNAGAGNNHFNWRYGTLSSSGCASVSWTIPQTQVTTTNIAQGPISIETDAFGNTWVALTTLAGTTYHVEVWQHASGAGAGTWVKEDDVAAGTVQIMGAIEPYPCGVVAGCAVLTYGTTLVTGATSIISSSCTPTCATWTAAVTTTSDYLMGSSSAVVIGNTVYFAGLASGSTGQTTGTLKFWSFPVGAASAPPETTIESTVAAWQAALCSSSTTLVLFEETSGTTVEYRTSVTFGGVWYPPLASGPISISTTETSATGLTAAYSGTFAATWTAGASSPYSIRFASLSMLSVVDSSAFAVHLIGSYVYQPSTNTLVAHYDIISSGPGVAANGLFDYWVGQGSQMDIPLPFNSFNWAVSTAYLVTVTTDAGVVVSETVTSPA